MTKDRRFSKASKISVFVITLCLLIFSSGESVSATPGRLKASSIINCGGVNYGHHGDGHWHKATKSKAGWDANGGSLGYNNPCGSPQAPDKEPVKKPDKTPAQAPVVQESAEAKAKREQAAREVEEKKLAEAAAQEAARIEQERLAEEARLKAEAEEAERVRLENIKLNDTSIQEIKLGAVLLSSSSDVVLMDYKEKIQPIIKTTNENASYNTTLKTDRVPFKLNDFTVEILSENGESTETFTYSFFDLGSKQELLEQDVKITYSLNDKTETISLTETEEGKVLNFNTLSEADASSIVVNSIDINGYIIELEGTNLLSNKGNVQFNEVTNFDFEIQGIEYSISYLIPKGENATFVVAIVGAGVTTGLGVGAFKRRKEKLKYLTR